MTTNRALPKPPTPDLTAPGEWLTTEQVEDLLSVSRSTLEKWRRFTDFPQPIKLPNRAVRYSRSALTTWLSQQAAA